MKFSDIITPDEQREIQEALKITQIRLAIGMLVVIQMPEILHTPGRKIHAPF